MLLQSRLARWIGAAVMGALAVLSFGALKRREGVQAERAKQAQRDAAADQEAHERMNDADLGLDATDDERRQRLRDFAAKHGARPPKAGGR
jgi:flagellar biosynthesis/type III secretory pathway M-ring protein FliF/YscJ